MRTPHHRLRRRGHRSHRRWSSTPSPAPMALHRPAAPDRHPTTNPPPLLRTRPPCTGPRTRVRKEPNGPLYLTDGKGKEEGCDRDHRERDCRHTPRGRSSSLPGGEAAQKRTSHDRHIRH